jgi:hypothetical protein
MTCTLSIRLLLALPAVLAFPSQLQNQQPYIKGDPAKGDVRSPCPALNALANHGYISRNGKGITSPALSTAVQQVYNADATFAGTLAYGGLPMVINSTGLTGSVTAYTTGIGLDNLAMHDAIEHDASLTRNDFAEGNQNDVQPKLVQALLDDAKGDYITIDSMARTRARREWDSRMKGSRKPLSQTAQTLAYGESALLLQALGKFVNGSTELSVLKADAKSWLGEEKLPDGWTKPAQQITFASTSALASKIQALVPKYKEEYMGGNNLGGKGM